MAKGKYEYWLTPEGLLKLEGWARDGLTDEQIAENIGITARALYKWKNTYVQIVHALKKGKEIADIQVENALFERALGGIHKVKKTFKVKKVYYDENGERCEKEELETGEDEVYIPGDTTAQIFWLKNRLPEKWREKQNVEISGELESEQSKLDSLLKQLRGDN